MHNVVLYWIYKVWKLILGNLNWTITLFFFKNYINFGTMFFYHYNNKIDKVFNCTYLFIFYSFFFNFILNEFSLVAYFVSLFKLLNSLIGFSWKYLLYVAVLCIGNCKNYSAFDVFEGMDIYISRPYNFFFPSTY